MEKIILIIITALGSLGEAWSHKALDAFEAWVTNSKTLVDNSLFYKAVKYIKSWEPKNPPVE
jgi:hypothetical protein